MKAKPDLAQSLLRELFSYDDGKLIWRVSLSKRVKPGDHAGYCHKRNSYRELMVQRKRYAEHRCVWVWHNGAIPDGLVVDHINNDRTDNRIENLRLLTTRQNKSRRGKVKPDQQGLPTCISKARRQYYVRISRNGKQHYLGGHKTLEEAIAVKDAFLAGAV